MGRTPSPSTRRRKDRDRDKRRKRSKDRSRERDRETKRHRTSRDRDRSRERERRRSRSRSYGRDYERDRSGPSSSKSRGGAERPNVSEADLEGKSPDEQEMLKVMGFCGFDTTKGKKVDGNDVGDVHVILKRKYRQYMNRKGGFNRPLDFVA